MRSLALVILAIALAPIASRAQTPKDSWDNLKQLREREKIKVVDTKLKSRTGNFVSVSEEALVVRTLQGRVSVERRNVLRVTNVGKSKRKRNATIGFAIGAVVGGSLLIGEEDTSKVLLGSWLGGMCAGVGALFPNYPTVYRSQAGPQGARPDLQGSSGAQQASKPVSEGVN